MLSALLAGALIAAASLLLGAAIMVVAGRPRHSAVGPAAGLSALLVICGIGVKLPGHGLAAAIATGLALAAALVALVRGRSPLGTVRVGAIVAVAGAVLVVAIPFATSGRVGILGQGLINDDMASHLLFADWADAREGPTPDLVEDGYPIGPHALVSATTKVSGADLVQGFAGLTGAIVILAALTAYGALAGVRDRFRAPAAVLCAIPYLSAAYLAQGAFKEPMLALALLGFALWLPSLASCWAGLQPTFVSTLPDRGRGWLKGQARLAIPGGVIAAGTIYNYSFPGLAWLLLAAVIWGLLIAWRERGRREGLQLRSRLRWSWPLLVVAVAIPVAAALTDILSLISFLSFEAFSPSGEGGNTGFGNLRQSLNPLEAFGIWPSAEFRIAPANADTPAIAFWLGGLLALVAFGWGLGRALARREAALPAALGAGALGYLVALAAGTPYTSAKSLAILAPIATVVTLRGLLGANSLPEEDGRAEWWPPRRLRPIVRLGVPALALAFVAAAALSTLLPLRQSAVGPTETAEELIDLRPLVGGEDVLFLGRDNFISWELLGAEVYTPILNHYDTEETSTLYRATPINAKFDWDNVPAQGLEGKGLQDFDWVLTTGAELNSEAPPEFAVALETDDFVLWERKPGAETPLPGEPGARRTLLEPLYPGATLDCADPAGAAVARLDGVARVLQRAPVIGTAWDPDSRITEAAGASQELSLPPGRWAISIQYASTQPLRLAAPAVGYEETMRTNLLFRGPSPFYAAGEVEVPALGADRPPDEVKGRARAVPVRFEATVEDPPLPGRVLGTESRAYLGTIAATPLSPQTPSGLAEVAPSASRGEVPLQGACTAYLDWYAVAAETPGSALATVEAPTVRPPQEGG